MYFTTYESNIPIEKLLRFVLAMSLLNRETLNAS